MKKWIIAAIVLLSLTNIVNAQDNKLGVTFDATYMSKYISKGKPVYGKQGGIFTTIDLDLYNSGLGVLVKRRDPMASGYVNSARYEYMIYYNNTAFQDRPYKMKYKVGWTYKHYYDNARNVKNKQEWWYKLSWPKLLPWNIDLCYNGYYETPAGSNYNNRKAAGWHHSFGIKRKLELAELLPPVTASAFIDYKDGLGGGSVDHDWSHSTFGLSTKFQLTDNLSFVPGLYHQITMDKSVTGQKDITYCSLSMKYNF